MLLPGTTLLPPRTEPIYELWRESAISELIAAKEITEFESYSMGPIDLNRLRTFESAG